MTDNVKQTNKHAENVTPKERKPIIGFLIVCCGVIAGIGFVITSFIPPTNTYDLPRQFWYADFRYWSDWVSYCCWLVFVWSLVSLVISIFVPQNSNRQFWFRQTFYQKLVAAFALFSIWVTWYNCSTLPLSVIFKPVSLFIHENYTQPLTDLYLAGYGYIIYAFAAVVVIALVTLRFWRSRKRGKHSNDTTTTMLLLVVCLQTTLYADEVSVPPKVKTSVGIYDVKSKDDIFNFTAAEIRELVKMEDDRVRGNRAQPHPVLVYCFEARSFKYTGGKYNDSEIRYRLHTPRKIVAGKKYPLVVHLHGVGEAGNDNVMSLAHLHSILPMMLSETQQDFFLLVLQCPSDNRIWTFQPNKDGNLDVLTAAIDSVKQNCQIDEQRISVFGLSSGGSGIWESFERYPKLFAAAVPVSASPSYNYLTVAAELKDTSIWAFANAGDGMVSAESIQKAAKYINGFGGFMELTRFSDGGHAAWRPAMDECNCFAWMIAQKRGSWFNPPPERKVYTYRSTSDSFVAFFLPALLTVFVTTFQRTRYCKQLRNNAVKEKSYPVRESNTDNDEPEVTKTNTENNEAEESIIITDQNFREWADTSGKKLELKLIAIKGDTARFELRDGRKAKMKITMLCQEDQEIIKNLAKF